MEKILGTEMSMSESREREKWKKAHRFRPTEKVKSSEQLPFYKLKNISHRYRRKKMRDGM